MARYEGVREEDMHRIIHYEPQVVDKVAKIADAIITEVYMNDLSSWDEGNALYFISHIEERECLAPKKAGEMHWSPVGKHEFDLFSCSSRDCDTFSNGFRSAFLEASWYQRPNSVSQIQWKLPPGWVIVAYGDKTGMDVLRDAIKKTLNIDVPTLNYPARPNTEPYVQFMIGPRPDNLLQLSQQ